MSNHETSHPKSLVCRVIFVALACFQSSLVAGILYGWASIDTTLLAAPTDQGGAGLTLDETTYLFSLGSSAAMVATLVLGVILDKFGPRFCSVLSHIIIASGCYLFSIASRENFDLFSWGACLIALGGPGIQVSNIHLANLFPKNQFLVLSGLSSSLTVSFAVFATFDWLWRRSLNSGEDPITFQKLFGSYIAIILVSLSTAALFWPDVPFEHLGSGDEDVDRSLMEERNFGSVEKNYAEAVASHHHLVEQPLRSYLRVQQDGSDEPISGRKEKRRRKYLKTKSTIYSKKAIDEGLLDLVSLKDLPFTSQLCSGTYIRALVVFLVLSYLASFYVASFSTEIADLNVFSKSEQHELAVILTLIMSAGVFFALPAGIIMDHIGLEACTVVTLILTLTQLAMLLVLGKESRTWLIVSMGVYNLFRQFLYPVFIGSLTSRLGFKYFGLLNGIGFALSGLTMTLMPAMVQAVSGDCHFLVMQQVKMKQTLESDVAATECDTGQWAELHAIQMIVVAFLLFLPICEYCDHRRRTERMKARYPQIDESWKQSEDDISSNYGSVHVEEEIQRPGRTVSFREQNGENISLTCGTDGVEAAPLRTVSHEQAFRFLIMY